MKNEGMKFLLGVPTTLVLASALPKTPFHGFILHVIVDMDAA